MEGTYSLFKPFVPEPRGVFYLMSGSCRVRLAGGKGIKTMHLKEARDRAALFAGCWAPLCNIWAGGISTRLILRISAICGLALFLVLLDSVGTLVDIPHGFASSWTAK